MSGDSPNNTTAADWWPTKPPNATMANAAATTTTVPINGTTELLSTTDFMYQTPEENMKQFYIGLFLAVISAIFTGSSFIFKKKGLLNYAKKNQGSRAGSGGLGYLKEWLWWAGMLDMALGELANFGAYIFAPATLVTPLGALSVVTSAALSSKFLKEKLNLLGKIGCGLCLIGSTLMVLHSPKEQEIASMEELQRKIMTPMFISFVVLLIVVSCVLIFAVAPRWGHKYVIVYVTICSCIGSFTVVGCKGMGVAIKETARGRNEFTNWLTYVLLIIVIGSILIELNFLNKALDTYNTAVVTPIYYVVFTTIVIIASVILLQEFGSMTPENIAGDICGFLTIIAGIFLLNAFKHMNISLRSLPKANKKEAVVTANGNAATVLEIEHELLMNGEPGSHSSAQLEQVNDASEDKDEESNSDDLSLDDIKVKT